MSSGAGARRRSTSAGGRLRLSRSTQLADRRVLRRARRTLRRELFEKLPGEQELQRISLYPITDAGPAAGSQPQTVLRDEAGRRYLFKLAPPEYIAAELFAYRLRSLGRCLHVPTARRALELPELGSVTGMLQPEIPVVAALEPDLQRWSKLQCEVMLREHPWEWLLANLDTHIDQYVLVGDRRVPINIDWDHSLVDLDQTELTRFNRRSATIAPIRNLLYSEYVLGRRQLDFQGMQLEARQITELSDSALDGLVDRYAEELELPEATRLELRERMRRRKATLVSDFDALVAALRHEHDDNLGLSSIRRSGLARLADRLRDAWQRFSIVVLHTHVLRPLLRAYRAVLRALARRPS
jgi:hypothetical protein